MVHSAVSSDGGVQIMNQYGWVVAALTLAAFSLAGAQTPPMPKSPVTLNVIDVAGDLALTQAAIEAYQAKHPELVSKVTFNKAPAPELAGKLKAMQAAGRSDIDLVYRPVWARCRQVST